ncbi:MAG TPA: hypothetical protein PK082_11465, partial [Phycisphaerae bacterium]|nr:hypothetical protein [Phycisphaerae bacterium]
MDFGGKAWNPPTVNLPGGETGLTVSIDEFYEGGAPERGSDWRAMCAALDACRERRAATLLLPRR